MKSAWPSVQLHDVADVVAGQAAPQESNAFGAVGLPFVRAGHLSVLSGGTYPELRISEEVARKYRLKRVPKGGVLFAKSGMSATKNVIVVLDQDAYIVSHICAVTPKNELDSRFLMYWLHSHPPSHLIRDPAYPSIRLQDVQALRVPLPPLLEQRRIAAILDKADAVRRKRQQTLDLADQFLRSAFLDMFGDPVTNPKRWPLRKLGAVIAEGPTNGLYKPASQYGSGTPIVRIDSYSGGDVVNTDNLRRVRLKSDESEKYALREDDILINRVNAPSHLGKSALVPPLREPTVYESNMMRLRVDGSSVDPLFLVTLLQDRSLKGQILKRARDAVNQSSINQSDVRSLEIVVPPLGRQREFRSLVARADGLREHSVSDRTKLSSLFGALVQRALRGEL